MSYDARTNELRELARQVPTTQESGQREQKVLLDAIDKWAGQRSFRLSKLADLVEKMDGNAERAFAEETTGLRGDMRPMFDCLRTSDVKTPSLEALKIVTQGGLEEDKFQTALEACLPVATAMDAVVRYIRELSEKIDALRLKWGESQKIATAIVVDEQEVVDEIAQVMKEAVDIEAPRHMNWREMIRAVVKTAKDAVKLIGVAAALIKGVPVPPEVMSQIPDKAEELITGPWEKMAGDLAARKARYNDYFSHDHDSLLVMFAGARADAQDFVDKHDYTKLVLEWTSKARAAVDALRSAASTSGQKADADALASRFSGAIENAERDAKGRWDGFVSENQSKFFGAISPDVEKALIGSDWDSTYKKVTAIDLQGLLQGWIGDAKRDFEEIDWTDLPDEWRDTLRERFRLSLEAFSKTDDEIANSNSPDALMTWLKTGPAALANKLRG